MRRSWLFTVVLFLLAGVFLVAGALKAANPAAFAETIRNYRLVPWPLAVAGALYLPWLEMMAGAGLLWRRTRKGALLLVLAMLLIFLAALVSAWGRGLNIDCGCFGAGEAGRGIPAALAQDLVLLGMAFALAWRERRAG